MPGLLLTLTGTKELRQTHPELEASAFPLVAPGQTVRLSSSGRRLGYCEYIDTSVVRDDLRNVVLLPGIPGTRFFTHPSVQRQHYVPGWRLVVLERPGIGLSDPAPTPYTYADFVADFREFCGLLGLGRVAVIGFSAGTPFATAIACIEQPPSPNNTSSPAPPDISTLPAQAEYPQSGPASATQPPSAPLPTTPPTAPAGAVPAGISAAAGAVQEPAAASTTANADDPTAGARERAAAGAPTEAAAGAEGAAGPGCGSVRGPAAGAGGPTPVPGSVTVEGVALISAIGPPDTPNKRRGMALLFQFAYWACTNLPWLVGWVVRSEAAAFRRRPVAALRSAFRPYSGRADREALKRPEVEALFLESALELYSRHQEDAVLRENLLFAGPAPWGFDLARRHTAVAIWQGGQDRGCTPAMAVHLAGCMGGAPKPGGSAPGPRPGGVTLNLVPEKGHMLYFDVWEEVVGWVNGLGRQGAGAVAPDF